MPSHSAEIHRYTPRWLLEGLNARFDLDPCSPKAHSPSKDYCNSFYSFENGQDGLALPWNGFVFLNPPWARGAKRQWIQKLYDHGNGIALVRSGTDAAFLHDYPPDAMFLLRGRVKYLLPEGETERVRKGGASGPFEPSQILAYGPAAMDVLAECSLTGIYCACISRCERKL